MEVLLRRSRSEFACLVWFDLGFIVRWIILYQNEIIQNWLFIPCLCFSWRSSRPTFTTIYRATHRGWKWSSTSSWIRKSAHIREFAVIPSNASNGQKLLSAKTEIVKSITNNSAGERRPIVDNLSGTMSEVSKISKNFEKKFDSKIFRVDGNLLCRLASKWYFRVNIVEFLTLTFKKTGKFSTQKSSVLGRFQLHF